MKRSVILVLALAMCFFAGNAFSEELTTGDISTIAGGQLLGGVGSTAGTPLAKMSTNVLIGAAFDSSGYAVDTYHTSGTKAYGTAFDSTALFWQELGVNGTLTAPTVSDGTAFDTGWTKM
jgi:hypothetical protein